MQIASYQYQAGQAWSTALDAALDSTRTVVLVFGSADPQPLAAGFADLRRTYPQATMIGCSSAGEILATDLHDDSLAVGVVRFDAVAHQLASTEVVPGESSVAVGERLGSALPAAGLRAVFVLSDGLQVNGTELIRGLSSRLPGNVVITGGLAGDGDRFQHTWVMVDGAATSGYVTALGLYGERLGFAHGSRGGWDAMGLDREVTRAQGNVLFELDGIPALELYEQYLGDMASALPAAGLRYPLAIRNDEERGGVTVCTILGIDREAGSITFAGDIPQGGFVRLMYANADRLIDASLQAVEQIDLGRIAAPVMSIPISCVGRRLVLGQRSDEEIEAVLSSLPQGTQQVGFYSYGEISPLASGVCDLHNQTMTLTLWWEH